MFEILDRSTGSIVGVRVAGKVTEADYERLVPVLERAIEEHGEVNVLCRFDGFTGIEPAAVWEDLKFDVRHLRDVARCAIVHDEAWQRWLAQLAGPPFGIETRVFASNEEEEAWSWLRREATEADAPATRRRARSTRRRLGALTEHLRSEAGRTDDPHGEALFETAAEVLEGLAKAFKHYEERAEEAWQAT